MTISFNSTHAGVPDVLYPVLQSSSC